MTLCQKKVRMLSCISRSFEEEEQEESEKANAFVCVKHSEQVTHLNVIKWHIECKGFVEVGIQCLLLHRRFLFLPLLLVQNQLDFNIWIYNTFNATFASLHSELYRQFCLLINLNLATGSQLTWSTSSVHWLYVFGLQNHHSELTSSGDVTQRETNLTQMFLL